MELKPCPFCGGQAHLRVGLDGRFLVECDDVVNCALVPSTLEFLDKTEAAEAWNCRLDQEGS